MEKKLLILLSICYAISLSIGAEEVAEAVAKVVDTTNVGEQSSAGGLSLPLLPPKDDTKASKLKVKKKNRSKIEKNWPNSLLSESESEEWEEGTEGEAENDSDFLSGITSVAKPETDFGDAHPWNSKPSADGLWLGTGGEGRPDTSWSSNLWGGSSDKGKPVESLPLSESDREPWVVDDDQEEKTVDETWGVGGKKKKKKTKPQVWGSKPNLWPSQGEEGQSDVGGQGANSWDDDEGKEEWNNDWQPRPGKGQGNPWQNPGGNRPGSHKGPQNGRPKPESEEAEEWTDEDNNEDNEWRPKPKPKPKPQSNWGDGGQGGGHGRPVLDNWGDQSGSSEAEEEPTGEKPSFQEENVELSDSLGDSQWWASGAESKPESNNEWNQDQDQNESWGSRPGNHGSGSGGSRPGGGSGKGGQGGNRPGGPGNGKKPNNRPNNQYDDNFEYPDYPEWGKTNQGKPQKYPNRPYYKPPNSWKPWLQNPRDSSKLEIVDPGILEKDAEPIETKAPSEVIEAVVEAVEAVQEKIAEETQKPEEVLATEKSE